MKALLLEDKGKWEEMKIGETDKPSPKAGEVLVRVKAAGLNPVDYKTATGGVPAWSYPHILGVDGAGIIEELGEGVDTWKVGDRVVFHSDMTKRGNYAEYNVTSAHTISRIPDEISFVDAVALPCAGYTAYQALFFKLHIQKGDSILIHAGAGGVGGFAIQLAKQAGLTVITTASTENHDYVKDLGADYAIDYREHDFVEEVMKVTDGLGVDHVLDAVNRENADKSVKALAFNGQIAFIAGPPDANANIRFDHPLSFHQVALGSVHGSGNYRQQQTLQTMGDIMLEMVQKGTLKTLVEKEITLEEVPEALKQLSERHVKGKIIATID